MEPTEEKDKMTDKHYQVSRLFLFSPVCRPNGGRVIAEVFHIFNRFVPYSMFVLRGMTVLYRSYKPSSL